MQRQTKVVRGAISKKRQSLADKIEKIGLICRAMPTGDPRRQFLEAERAKLGEELSKLRRGTIRQKLAGWE